jgi:hypothetical protein
LRIYKLAPDYLSVVAQVYTWKEKIESPALLKRNGIYYMFGSHLSGWAPNDNVYSTAQSISGPWSQWKNFAPKGSRTYNSQTAFVLPLTNELAIYMGDRWVEKSLSRSTYIWLPLDINGHEVSMRNYESWDLSVSLGTWKPTGPETLFKAQNGQLKNGARMLPNDAAGYIGGPEHGSITFNQVQSKQKQRKSLKIFYRNGDQATRHASLSINNGNPQKVAFLSTENNIGISVYTIELIEGNNSISVSGVGNSWGPDIVSISVAS